MKSTTFPIISAEKGPTSAPCDFGIRHTHFSFILGGLTAHAIEQAQRSSFYGIRGNTPEAARAMREIQEAVTAWMDEHAPSWTAYYVESAQALDTTGAPIPYRAKVAVTADHITREI